MKVLDFGAGTGLVCAHVAPHVEQVLAVDISASMLEKLAAKPELKGKVEPICQNILEEPLNVEVDLIVSAMAMHHVDDTELLFQTFSSHLAPGGRIAVADLDKEDGSFHPADIEGVFHQGFDREALRSLASANGFESIEFCTAVSVTRNEIDYPIFLLTAVKT